MSGLDSEASTMIDRRRVLGLIGSVAAGAILATTMRPESASARRVWCRLDPSFLVDGLVGNVYVSGELDRAYDTTGPIQLHFVVPEGTQVDLLATDAGFGHGYEIVHHTDSRLTSDHERVEIEIQIMVPAVSDKLPIQVEFVPGATVEVEDVKFGATNKWITVKTQLRRPEETHEQKKARQDAEKAEKEATKQAKKDAKQAEKDAKGT